MYTRPHRQRIVLHGSARRVSKIGTTRFATHRSIMAAVAMRSVTTLCICLFPFSPYQEAVGRPQQTTPLGVVSSTKGRLSQSSVSLLAEQLAAILADDQLSIYSHTYTHTSIYTDLYTHTLCFFLSNKYCKYSELCVPSLLCCNL